MDAIAGLLGNTYGLDWAVLMFGLTSTHFLAGGQLRRGLAISCGACVCGFTLACISGQTGFIVYNILLLGLNARGLMRGERREFNLEKRITNENNGAAFSEAVPVSVHAR